MTMIIAINMIVRAIISYQLINTFSVKSNDEFRERENCELPIMSYVTCILGWALQHQVCDPNVYHLF